MRFLLVWPPFKINHPDWVQYLHCKFVLASIFITALKVSPSATVWLTCCLYWQASASPPLPPHWCLCWWAFALTHPYIIWQAHPSIPILSQVPDWEHAICILFLHNYQWCMKWRCPQCVCCCLFQDILEFPFLGALYDADIAQKQHRHEMVAAWLTTTPAALSGSECMS